MKTKEEIVNGVIARFSNELGNIYEAGRAFERTNPWVVYKEELDQEKKKSYDEGYTAGYQMAESIYHDCYLNGLNSAWKAVNRIENSDDFTECELEDMFNVANISDIYSDCTAFEVVEKFNEYDERYTGFKQGDEVSDGVDTGVVTYVDSSGNISIMLNDGSIGIWESKSDGWYKTGNHISALQDIINMLGGKT